MSETPYLSDAEVVELTGYVQAAAQERWLAERGVKTLGRNARNKVRVPRDAVTARPGAPKAVARTEPDFTKVRRAS